MAADISRVRFDPLRHFAGVALQQGRLLLDADWNELVAETPGRTLGASTPLLTERRGTADTPYLEQPYWLPPDPLPAGGPHLAYLDVWQREVTHLQAPDLVEVAVGVDTTTRLQ